MTNSRRSFLKSTALLGAGLGYLSASASNVMAASTDSPPAPAGAVTSSSAGAKPFRVISMDLLEKQAQNTISEASYTFVARGAGSEWTLRQNLSVFQNYPVKTRRLAGLSKDQIDVSTNILGLELPFPVIVAPMGAHGFVSPLAEAGSASGASSIDALYTASGASNLSLEEIANASHDGPVWFQLYFNADQSITRQLLRRAKTAGYKAIVLTIDAVGPGTSDAFAAMGNPFPPDMKLGNYEASKGGSGNFYNQKLNFTPDDIRFCSAESGLPVIVKGIMNPQDALGAIAAGATGIQVSNHGGRQIDGVPASLSILPDIVEAVDGKARVIFDSGIRSGVDVFRALALGADAVCLGRPVLYGLGAGGAEGVRAVLEHVRDQLNLAMMFAGCRKIADISKGNLLDFSPQETAN